MKRSNRLILLIGIFLAIVAFIGIVLIFQQNQATPGQAAAPTELPTVLATQDIPLGTQIVEGMYEVRSMPVTARAADAIQDPSQILGKTVRTDIATGAQITQAMFATARGGTTDITPLIDQGLTAIGIQVDQVSGVGTLINVGDRVDVVAGFTGSNFPVITIDPTTQAITPVQGINSTSVKVLLQGLQVVGTLLPPPPAEQNQGGAAQPGAGNETVNLTGQQEIVLVAATTQQAEVIKFAQMDGSITLILRSPKDFRDEAGNAVAPPPVPTSGIILKTLIDEYGVLPPELIEAVLPRGIQP